MTRLFLAAIALLSGLALAACDTGTTYSGTAPGVPDDAYYQDIAEDAVKDIDTSDFDALTEG